MQQGPSVAGAIGERQVGGRPAGGGGWRAKLSPAQAWAAADIGRAIEHQGCVAAAGLRAVDAGRLVVDGGAWRVGAMSGGCGVADNRVVRWNEYRFAVRERELKRVMVRGRRGALYLDALLVKVVIEGQTPAALDAELGVREGRCQQAVLAELKAYAEMHISAWQWEKRA